MSHNNPWDGNATYVSQPGSEHNSFHTLPAPSTNAMYPNPPYHDLYGQSVLTIDPNDQSGFSYPWEGGASNNSQFPTRQHVQYDPGPFPGPYPGRSDQQVYGTWPTNPVQISRNLNYNAREPSTITNYTTAPPPSTNRGSGSQNPQNSLVSGRPTTKTSSNTDYVRSAPALPGYKPEFEIKCTFAQPFTQPKQTNDVMEYLHRDPTHHLCHPIRLGGGSWQKYYLDVFLNQCVVYMDNVVTADKQGTNFTGLWEFQRTDDGFLQEAVVVPLNDQQSCYWYIILSSYPAGTIRGLLGFPLAGQRFQHRSGVGQAPRKPRQLLPKPRS